MTIREIQASIQEGDSLKDITQAYSEISLIRINAIRQSTERARAFFDEITKIYSLVRQQANPAHLGQKEFKKVKLVLTSNYHFYGHIDALVMDFFIKDIRDKQGDIIIVGQGGARFLSANHFNYQFSNLKFKKDIPDKSEMNDLIKIVKNYTQVLVYFAKFKNILTQTPTILDITQTQNQLTGSHPLNEPLFIFEPETKQILDFFDGQIKDIILQQLFLEAELARNSSRLIAMDQSQYNANLYLKQQNRLLSVAKMSVENSKLIELLVSITKSISINNKEII